MITSNAASTPMIRPARNPPPMNRLSIAVGKTMKADSTRKPKKNMTNPPRITRPSTTPSMTPKELIGATHGNNPTHTAKKTGDSSAIPLATMSAAATKNNAAGAHQNRTRNGGRRNGPYKTPPGGTICGGSACRGIRLL